MAYMPVSNTQPIFLMIFLLECTIKPIQIEMQVNMYDYNSASKTGLVSKHITIGFAELLTQAEKKYLTR